jgi:hypothetical protein
MVFSNWREIGNERIYIATEYSTVTAWSGMGMKVARDTRQRADRNAGGAEQPNESLVSAAG